MSAPSRHRAIPFALAGAAALALVALAATPAWAQKSRELTATVTSRTVPTLCAEDDNVYLTLSGAKIRHFRIEARHPAVIGSIVVSLGCETMNATSLAQGIAEGVENFEQVAHLRELGIRSAQGYVFAPPLPGSAFIKLIEAIEPAAAEQPAEPRYLAARQRIAAM